MSSFAVQNIFYVDKKAVGERVKSLRISSKLSQEKFATSIGMSRSGLTQIESGATFPSLDTLEKLVEQYRSSFDDLLSSAGQSGRGKGIPLYDIYAAAGPVEMYNDLREYIIDYMHLPETDVNGFDFAVKVWGPSMQGVFNDGDIALCKEVKDRTLINYGAPYFIITSEFKTIKYVHTSDKEGYVRLRSENELFDTFEIPMDSIYKIFHAKVAVAVRRISN
jgi:transcriptional regulator with XRE-family HTH domain